MRLDPIIFRIDDRLIHGQVLIGWGSQYPIKHYIIGNNDIVNNEWEKKIILMAVSSGINAQIFNLDETLEYIHQYIHSDEMSMILVNSPFDIGQMAEKNLSHKRINVGGMHFSEGKKEYLPYLYLNQQEVQLFRDLMNRGFVFECQDIPNATKYNLAKLLKE